MIRKILTAVLLSTTAAAVAQVPAGNSAPQPTPIVDTIPAAVDQPYPGTIDLVVDATDTTRGIFRVTETIPVAKPGRMTLLYPKWLPGNHSPTGQIEKLTGLVVKAGGRVLPWTRDAVDMFAFHVDVPDGSTRLEASFEFVAATKENQGRIVMTPTMISLQPNSVSLYPAGYYTRRIPVRMTVKYPRRMDRRGRAFGENFGIDVRLRADELRNPRRFADPRGQICKSIRIKPAREPQRLRRHPDRARRHASAD